MQKQLINNIIVETLPTKLIYITQIRSTIRMMNVLLSLAYQIVNVQ